LHKEAVSEVKDAANTLVVVATLVISLGITAGMTISVNDIDGTQANSYFSEEDMVYVIFPINCIWNMLLCFIYVLLCFSYSSFKLGTKR